MLRGAFLRLIAPFAYPGITGSTQEHYESTHEHSEHNNCHGNSLYYGEWRASMRQIAHFALSKSANMRF